MGGADLNDVSIALRMVLSMEGVACRRIRCTASQSVQSEVIVDAATDDVIREMVGDRNVLSGEVQVRRNSRVEATKVDVEILYLSAPIGPEVIFGTAAESSSTRSRIRSGSNL